jgi:curved DNA-binding protein CbpA
MARSVAYNGKDLYKLLRVSHTATEVDIKKSYRAIALELHPDRNNGCKYKLALFKEVNEAYAVLRNEEKRQSYDYIQGFSKTMKKSTAAGNTTKNERKPPPPNYRKVYRPEAPPEWNGKMWDHEYHYEMHYGDGFKKQILEQFRKEAAAQGAFEYKSPVGRGFTMNTNGQAASNPYARSNAGKIHKQGRSQYVREEEFSFEYEESDNLHGGPTLKVHKSETVNQNLNKRRHIRRTKSSFHTADDSTKTANSAFTKQEDTGCVIM